MSFVPNDYELNVARGNVTGAQPFFGAGEHVASGASSGVIWTNGAFVFPPSAGVQMALVSTSANDAAAGTGIRTVILSYLDASLAQKTETVTLNGTTPVLTVATNIRFIQNMYTASIGSGGAAAGDVSASNGGTTYEIIPTGKLTSSNATKMVPAGKRLVATSFYGGAASGSAAAQVVVRLASPEFGGVDLRSQNLLFPLAGAAYQDMSSGLTVPCPLVFTAGQVLTMTFQTDKAATIVGTWFGWLENA